MLRELLAGLPPDAVKIALVFALAFFIGLEREEHKQHDSAYSFGGVRTFPLIGLVSYSLALVSAPNLTPWAIGLAVVGGLMMVSYHHKLASHSPAGLTTEISALATFVLGGLVEYDHYWIATTIGVLSVLLLELKNALENLTKRVASEEITTFAKFVVLAGVILPIVPDHALTRFALNPFKTWLVVVAVSGVSFASYVLQTVLKRRGLLLSAVLGGAYSSTVTTVVLARQAKHASRPNLFAGSILTASGMMYGRFVLLLAFFNRPLALRLGPTFAALGLIGGAAGWAVSRRPDTASAGIAPRSAARNPLELRAAFAFAGVFVLVLVLTALAREYLGHAGLYALAGLMGVTDVDPFVLGLTQASSVATPVRVAAVSILIAAASNNVVKGIYAYSFADRETGRRALALLLALAALGLVPLLWT